MQAPKILPRIAHQAGISEELALKLWRRAASEAERLCGKADGAEYWGLAVDRFLDIVEQETGRAAPADLTPAANVAWLWRQQSRASLLTLVATQQACRVWQATWERLADHQKAA